MRILVTGSSGRIGAAIAACLSKRHEVVGLDVRQGRWTSVAGDVTDVALVRRLTANIDAVVHTASLHAPHVGQRSDEDFRRINVDGTAALLEGAAERGLRRFVYTSTTSLYGHALVPQGEAVWVTEDLEPSPRDIYDETKIAAEGLCSEASGEGLTCVSLRMSRCFPEPDDIVAGYRLHRGVDARDVAEAHLRALEAPIQGYDVFNVSMESVFRPEDCGVLLVDAPTVIRSRLPWAEEEFLRRGWSLPGSIDRVYVTEKATRVLGFQPRYGLRAFLDDRPGVA